jgi:hypothetical protein
MIKEDEKCVKTEKKNMKPQRLVYENTVKYKNVSDERNYGFAKGVEVVRFEVFTAVTMTNSVLWDVTPCGSCKNRRFGGT